MTKKITMEDLAAMVQEEFEATRKQMATKEDLGAAKHELEGHIRDLAASVTKVERMLEPVTPLPETVRSLDRRVARLEKKVGLSD